MARHLSDRCRATVCFRPRRLLCAGVGNAERAEQAEWDGVTIRSDYTETNVADRDRLADAARTAHWPEVLRILAEHPWVNLPRVGGRTGFAPLHQAAWHGADPEITGRLVRLGGWRTLRGNDGRRPIDIAEERGHHQLLDILRPDPVQQLPEDVLAGLEEQLYLLIRGRVPDLVTEHRLRLPQLAPLTELTVPRLWFPVPGMYGGFSIELARAELTVRSWNRVFGGWAQTHRVTANSIHLVESGWDS